MTHRVIDSGSAGERTFHGRGEMYTHLRNMDKIRIGGV